MKVRKTVVVAAAVGALTALGASSAMAFEHEFHGAFQLQYDVSNFNGTNNVVDSQGDTGGFGSYDPSGNDKNAPTASFFEQRARLAYIGKASDKLKLVSKFEIDYKFWGNSSYTTARNSGGALGSDSVNIETKHLYLDVNLNDKTNLKMGMQGFDDAFKGIFASADMAGLYLTHSYANAAASAGFFRWNDDGFDLGKNTRDMFVLDGKFKLSKDAKLGAAYYLVQSEANRDQFAYGPGDNFEDVTAHLIGVNGEATFGKLTVDGFFAYQFGTDGVTVSKPVSNDISAFAANVGARMKAGKGTLRGDFLYASGDDSPGSGTSNAFYTPVGFGLSESGYYSNEMVILGRDKYAMTIDGSIVYDVNNRDRGVIFVSAGYDMPLSNTLSCSTNLGLAWNAEKQPGDEGKYLGTEVNAELGYKFSDNLNFVARGGYVFLGEFFDNAAANGTPDDLYDVKLIAQYSF